MDPEKVKHLTPFDIYRLLLKAGMPEKKAKLFKGLLINLILFSFFRIKIFYFIFKTMQLMERFY